MIEHSDRRKFLNKAGVIVVATGLKLFPQPAFAAGTKVVEEDVSPLEDLMREHGLLSRVLLIYDHCSNRLQNKEDLDLKQLAESRDIIQNFVEAYHEKLEEQHLFPRFEKAHKLTDLVSVLRCQHQAGRHVTADIGAALTKKDHTALIFHLRAFTHMYRPHEAREDTVLFPAFQALVSKREYNELGEQFEEREHQLFGKDGFEGQVARVEQIERQLGIYDLSQFTPKV